MDIQRPEVDIQEDRSLKILLDENSYDVNYDFVSDNHDSHDGQS